MNKTLISMIAGLALVSCSQSREPGRTPPPVGNWTSSSLAQLTRASSCDDLQESLRQSALEDMNKRLDENLQSMLNGNYWGCYLEDGAYGPPMAGTTGGTKTGASEYSTTNNQVAGVDEADFIKNDATWLYVLADGKLQIVQAWPPPSSTVVSRFAIEGTPLKLFVNSDRAVVYSSLPGSTTPPEPYGPYSYGRGECTYGYDCEFTGDGHPMKITVVDIKDRAQPVLLRELWLNGSFINARRIGDAVHTVVAFPDVMFSGLKYWPDELMWNCGTVDPITAQAAFEQLRAENTALIMNAQLTDWLPSLKDTKHVMGQAFTSEGPISSCTDFYESQVNDGKSFLSLASFNLNAMDPLSVSTIVGRPGAVYASAEALYVAARHGQPEYGPWFWDASSGPTEATTIHKFTLDPLAHNAYAGSGVAKGRVLNQFSMDEYEGAFRVATTTGHLPSPDVHSTITALEQRGGELVEIGRLDGLAPAEDIRSARFDGPRGFIVTFKKTDPLFVIDLADPRAPRVAGELHIPGFSTYMHMMDATHLLSIGFDAQDMGSFAWFQGVQLQIFDIANPAAPTLAHKTVIGTRGTSSEAATNHLAFNYFAPKELLALPMVICEGGSGGGSYGDLMTFSGLMVFKVNVTDGFTYRGGVPHQAPETPDTYYGGCGMWWSDSSSHVKRSVVMDEYIFSVAEDAIKVALVDAPASIVADVALKTAP